MIRLQLFKTINNNKTRSPFQTIFEFPRKQNPNEHVHTTYRVKLFGVVCGAVCTLCIYGWRRRRQIEKNIRHIRTQHGEKKRNLVALLLLAELLTICYITRTKILIARSTLVRSLPSSFMKVHSHNRCTEKERQTHAFAHTHTHDHFEICKHINCEGMLILLARDEDMVYCLTT